MTINFSLICQLFSGSGQIRNAGTNYPSPGLAKIAPWWLAAGTVFRLKYSMTQRRAAPPTFTPSKAGPLAQIVLRFYWPSAAIYWAYHDIQISRHLD